MQGYHTLPVEDASPRYLAAAQNITHTCHQMYMKAPNRVSPEMVTFVSAPKSDGGPGMFGGPHVDSLLRPEAIEALYYMHYYTGDHQYRVKAYQIFKAINEHCKSNYGYSSLYDVHMEPPIQLDNQESFFLAETLKYLYLIFSPRNKGVDLNQWVFNTEGHPLKIWKTTKS
eukprot:Platyproteum_vivax@DN6041_c0_g1_i3.p1